MEKKQLIFFQCPTGYCCTKSADCIQYNSCQDKRAGILCGRCKTNYVLSLSSTDCLFISQCCHDYFWIRVAAGFTFYLILYIFKDNTFHCISAICTKLYNIFFPTEPTYRSDQSIFQEFMFYRILSNFVQTSFLIRSHLLPETTSSHLIILLRKINFYFSIFLGFNISSFSLTTCPSFKFNAAKKAVFDLSFLFIVLCSCFFLYVSALLLNSFSPSRKFFRHYVKLLIGFITFIRFSYSKFIIICIKSLICIKIHGSLVWFYDGNVKCMSSFQFMSLGIMIFYLIPILFYISLGTDLLRARRVHFGVILWGYIFPFPCSCYLLAKYYVCEKYNTVASKKDCQLTMFERFFEKIRCKSFLENEQTKNKSHDIVQVKPDAKEEKVVINEASKCQATCQDICTVEVTCL